MENSSTDTDTIIRVEPITVVEDEPEAGGVISALASSKHNSADVDDDEKSEGSEHDDLDVHNEKEALMEKEKRQHRQSRKRPSNSDDDDDDDNSKSSKNRNSTEDEEEDEDEDEGYGTGNGKRMRAPRKREERGLMFMIWLMIASGFFSVVILDFGVGGYYKYAWGWAAVTIYTLFVVLLVTTFVMVTKTDTYVDRNWVPSGVSLDKLEEVKLKSKELDELYQQDKTARALSHYEDLRYCNKCKAYQPIRSHHCKYTTKRYFLCGLLVFTIAHHTFFILFLILLP